MKWNKSLPAAVCSLLLAACQTTTSTPVPFDYSAFRESRPASILVLPPLNESPDIKATWGMMSAAVFPLAEAGYYVFPAAVVSETFKQNGLDNPADIHNVQLDKLRRIFGNDAVLYITVKEYGTSYQLVESVTAVSAQARLVDARNGKELWHGSVSVSDAGQNNSGGLLGALLSAVINQVVGTLGDRAYDMAQTAGIRLLSPQAKDGILHGPRSPHYAQ